MNGTLFVVATPIGNLSDMTFRAIDTLKKVSVIAAEDTRVTKKLLSRYEIETRLVSYREQNAAQCVPELIKLLKQNNDVAIVSDAGTPSISDPGFDLVKAAHMEDITVSPIPGASALSAAVSASGVSGDGVRFMGFLPRKGKARDARLQAIAEDSCSTVIYESPHRLNATLKDLSAVCGVDRIAVVFRELTKLHEEIKKDSLKNLMSHFKGDIKGEITLVLEGATSINVEEISPETLEQLILEQLEKGKSVRDISASLAASLGKKKKEIYNIALSLISK